MDTKMKLAGALLLLSLITSVSATPPVANYSVSITSGAAPLNVSFHDSSLNNPLGWGWFFGDEKYTGPWTLVNKNASWSARKGHCSVAMPDGSIVLMGGKVTRVGNMNDTWRSVDSGATWTQMTPGAGWSAREAFGSVVLPDGSIVLMGGRDSSGARNDTWRSVDSGATWTQMTPAAGWSAREAFGSAVLSDGSIVLMAGSSFEKQNNDVWRSTDSGATWTQMTASTGWEARQFPSCVVMPDDSIVLIGGWAGRSAINDVWRSQDNGTTWTQVSGNAEWAARDRLSSVVTPAGCIILMGGDTGNSNANDVWRLIPVGSSIQNPSHIYTLPGNYQVTLQVYNPDGYDSTRMTGHITVTSAGGISPPPGNDNEILSQVVKFIQNILLRK